MSEGYGRGFTHPAVFLFLFLPFGAIPGYVTVTLAFLLADSGVGMETVAGLMALALLPHTWKVLWAPVVDTTLSIRRWYVLAAAVSSLCLFAMGFVPGGLLWLLSGLILLASLAGTLIGMSTEWLMAHTVSDDSKGRASGWAQAGNVAGASVGGGAALWIATHYAVWAGAAVLAVVDLACCLALFFVAQVSLPVRAGVWRSVVDVGRDVWSIARSNKGMLTLFLLVLPVGSGGAPHLIAAIAHDWNAGSDTVALVRGVIGGAIALAGALVGGFLSDRVDRRTAYLVFGVLLAFCAAGMALAPHTSEMFMLFVCLYSFINGFVFAGFSAVVLDAIGAGAAATKFSLMASLGNFPAFYMTLLDGWVQERWGSAALLLTDAGLGLAGAAVFLAATAFSRRITTAAA